MEKALFTGGVSGGFYNSEGKLLLRKRDMDGSYPGKWELPGGAIQKKHLEIGDERAIGNALKERVFEEIGINIEIQRIPALYATIPLKGDDIAFATIVGVLPDRISLKGETMFVDVDELNALAESGELLSGKGRMYRMCLRMLASRDCPSPEIRKTAGKELSLL